MRASIFHLPATPFEQGCHPTPPLSPHARQFSKQHGRARSERMVLRGNRHPLVSVPSPLRSHIGSDRRRAPPASRHTVDRLLSRTASRPLSTAAAASCRLRRLHRRLHHYLLSAVSTAVSIHGRLYARPPRPRGRLDLAATATSPPLTSSPRCCQSLTSPRDAGALTSAPSIAHSSIGPLSTKALLSAPHWGHVKPSPKNLNSRPAAGKSM